MSEFKLTSRIRFGIQPDRLMMPPSSYSVVSPTIRLRAAPWLNPHKTILRESIPDWTCASMIFSMASIDSEVPISSYSSFCGGSCQMLNQEGLIWWWLHATGLLGLREREYVSEYRLWLSDKELTLEVKSKARGEDMALVLEEQDLPKSRCTVLIPAQSHSSGFFF